jgi:hypothetical protein
MAKACSTLGDKRNAYRFLVGKSKERDNWEGLDVGGILDKQDGVAWTGFMWPNIWTS